MSSLERLLFPLPDTRRTPLSLLRWWESRRLTFNLTVGGAGVVTLIALRIGFLLTRTSWDAFMNWRPVIAYAILANVCYTLGWTLETLAQRVWGEKCPRFGPALFRQGLAFSVGLTLLPILIGGIGVAAYAAWSVVR